jgi:hypothetical protein
MSHVSLFPEWALPVNIISYLFFDGVDELSDADVALHVVADLATIFIKLFSPLLKVRQRFFRIV